MYVSYILVVIGLGDWLASLGGRGGPKKGTERNGG